MANVWFLLLAAASIIITCFVKSRLNKIADSRHLLSISRRISTPFDLRASLCLYLCPCLFVSLVSLSLSTSMSLCILFLYFEVEEFFPVEGGCRCIGRQVYTRYSRQRCTNINKSNKSKTYILQEEQKQKVYKQGQQRQEEQVPGKKKQEVHKQEQQKHKKSQQEE